VNKVTIDIPGSLATLLPSMSTINNRAMIIGVIILIIVVTFILALILFGLLTAILNVMKFLVEASAFRLGRGVRFIRRLI
jgi:hypothetical protein